MPGLRQVLQTHEAYAQASIAIFAVVLAWRLIGPRFLPRLVRRAVPVYLLLIALGLGSLTLAGHYGGLMVWGRGAPAQGVIVPLTGESRGR